MPNFWPPFPSTGPLRLLLILLVLFLHGCSTWQRPQTAADQMSRALERGDYGTALAIIDDASEADPLYEQLRAERPAVLLASRTYREQAQDKARQLAEKSHWASAYEVLQQARKRVVHSEPIDTLLHQLHDEEHSQLRDTLTTWFLAAGQALLNTSQVDAALAAHPGATAQRLYSQRHQLQKETIRQLTRAGTEYAIAERWYSSYQALEMAQRLDPEGTPPAALAQARQALGQAEGRAEKAHHEATAARQQAQYNQARALVEQYRRSRQLQDLLAARNFLQDHPQLQLAPDRRQVAQWSKQQFRDKVQRGDTLYAQRRYRAAYRLWKRAQPLSPNNPELEGKLQRASKVLNSLREISAP